MKREVLEFRRAVAPLARPLRWLTEARTPLVPAEVRSYFRDVDDHHITVAERVAGFDQLLTNLVDATVAKLSLQQNSDMRKITAWAAIIAVPTMVTGLYGMNFDNMPLLHWEWGYPIVLVGMLAVCLVLYRSFKHREWL
jgi:magnesium transporter